MGQERIVGRQRVQRAEYMARFGDGYAAASNVTRDSVRELGKEVRAIPPMQKTGSIDFSKSRGKTEVIPEEISKPA